MQRYLVPMHTERRVDSAYILQTTIYKKSNILRAATSRRAPLQLQLDAAHVHCARLITSTTTVTLMT